MSLSDRPESQGENSSAWQDGGAAVRRSPALTLAGLLAAGILAGRSVQWPGTLETAIAGAVIAGLLRVAGWFFRRERMAVLSIAVLIFFGGLILYRLHEQVNSAIMKDWNFSPGETALIGHLEGPPWRVENPRLGQVRTRFRFDVEQQLCQDENRWVRGGYGLLVEAPAEWESRLNGAERLGLLARLRTASGFSNPGLFDYREYLQEQGLAGLARVEEFGDLKILPDNGLSLVQRLRSRLNGIHRDMYPDPAVRGVAGALLLGLREQNPRPVRQDFVLSGTVHVLVVSGLHVGFIALVLSSVLSLIFGRGWIQALATLAGALVFAVLCGAGPSVMRAVFMCALVLLAQPLQQPIRPLNILAASFALLLLFNPFWLFDPGFQLSFAAVAGIICLTPALEQPFRRFKWFENKWKRWPVSAFLASCSAQLAVAPLLAWYFGGVSAVGLAANVFMVPLSGLAVTGGFLSGLAALIWLPAGQALAFINAVPIKGMLCIARFFAGLEWSWLSVPFPGPLDVVLFWAFLWQASRFVLGHHKAGARLALTAVIWLNCLVWTGPISALWGNPRLDILDLGRTGAAVLHFPSGECFLETPDRGVRDGYSTARDVAVPYLERNHTGQVSWLYLSGIEPSRIRWAWDVLDRVAVRNVLVQRSASSDSLVFQFLHYAQSRGAKLVELAPGDSFGLDGVQVSVGAEGHLRMDCRGAKFNLEQGGWRIVSGMGRELTVVPERAKHKLDTERISLETSKSGAVRVEFKPEGKMAVSSVRGGVVSGL